jgi:hypothetical protein
VRHEGEVVGKAQRTITLRHTAAALTVVADFFSSGPSTDSFVRESKSLEQHFSRRLAVRPNPLHRVVRHNWLHIFGQFVL